MKTEKRPQKHSTCLCCQLCILSEPSKQIVIQGAHLGSAMPSRSHPFLFPHLKRWQIHTMILCQLPGRVELHSKVLYNTLKPENFVCRNTENMPDRTICRNSKIRTNPSRWFFAQSLLGLDTYGIRISSEYAFRFAPLMAYGETSSSGLVRARERNRISWEILWIKLCK